MSPVLQVRVEDVRLRDRAPVGCIYRTLGRNIDRDVLANLARNGFDAKTNDEKIVMRTVGMRISACERSQGWGEKRKQIAIRYFSGRVLESNARYRLKEHGVETAHFEAGLAALDEAAQALVAQGSISNANLNVAWKAAVAAGAGIDAVPEDQRQPIAELMLQGLVGMSNMVAAETAYREG
ncbi:MAG: hypothetical protein CVT77_12315 [Alphaproteobacteria bacterium HGW-Alphaproteobacteria-16]|nr:MAG: hypothetical protein CVT77_12315 [Alphaproteobacteria bacterium HGW-Alphaproteobacteria-16]